MDLQYFPQFLKTVFSGIYKQFSKEEITEVGIEFKKYLQEKFPEPTAKQLEIMDITFRTIIPRFEHPLYHRGYHPALVWHLTEFVRLQQEANKK